MVAAGVWQVVAAPRVSAVTPGPDSYVKDASGTIVLTVHGLQSLKDVRLTMDGGDITHAAARSGDTLTFSPGTLADGEHTVAFSGTSSNLFRHDVRKRWRFTVDTSIPTLALSGTAEEGRINTSPATFSGTTEPYATVVVTSGPLKASGIADASGSYTVLMPLVQGPAQVSIVTTDRAGNATQKQLDVFVDTDPPTVEVTDLDWIEDADHLRLVVASVDTLATPVVKAVLDGEETQLIGAPSHARLVLSNLAQGRHMLVVTASDRGGNVVTDRQSFIVDSTEHFGSAALWPGARGKDVRQLQARLVAAGVFRGMVNGTYDRRTTTAVRDFQEKYGLEVNGLVSGAVLTALSGQIIVDLGDLRLYLYRDGKLQVSYPVAAGQPRYPTPTGDYSVTSKVMDPTWYPPNSDWAKDAKPIPPGVENPLGTRWIGTSAPGVGIHGTPEDSSVGSYASHGCIRMHIPDVEALFPLVTVGMPVIIRP